jgi:hypothetical protein
MAPRRSLFRVLSAVVLFLTLALAVTSPAIAQADKNQCKRGGWTELSPDGVTPFRNQGQCVSHVVRGGDLYPLSAAASLDVTWIWDGTSQFYSAHVAGTGLQPGANVFLHIVNQAGQAFDIDVSDVGPGGTVDTSIGGGVFFCNAYASTYFWTTTATGDVIETAHDTHPC